MLDILSRIRWTDIADLLLVAALIWAVFAWLRRTRSRLAFVGVVFLSAIYLAARQLHLQLTVWILQGFSAVLVIVLVVIFQDDLRRLFEQIAVWGLLRKGSDLPADAADVLVRAVTEQARKRMGALYVIPGREAVEPHLEGGIGLDAKWSVPLLLSLFDHHSPGHDGAVIIAGQHVSRFAVHLPLSTDHARVGPGGTRHAAALGLAERTDALCVVVSEERGTVSVARGGKLRVLETPGHLSGEIRSFLDQTAPAGDKRRVWSGAFRRWREALAALALAVAMWAVLIPGSDLAKVERTAQVAVDNLPAGYVLTGVDPPEIRVTLEGPRLFLPGPAETLRLRIEPDASLVELGRRTFDVSPSQVETPARVTALAVEPQSLRLTLEQPGS